MSNSNEVEKKMKNNPEKKKNQSSGVRGMGEVAHWVMKTQVVKPFNLLPLVWFNANGILFGRLMFGKMRRRIRSGIKVFYPEIRGKKLQNLIEGFLNYLGTMVLDVLIHIPHMLALRKADPKLIKYHRVDRLDKGYEENKGVLIPSLHLGQVFYPLGGIFGGADPKNPSGFYKLTTLAESSNLSMFRLMIAAFPDYHVFETDKFAIVEKKILPYLKKNHGFLSYHDYMGKNQLRIPFAPPRFNFLKPTPMSIAKLHRKTRAPIVPVAGVPVDAFSRSLLVFPPNELIKETSDKYWDHDDETFLKHVTYAINKTLNIYAAKHITGWQQLLSFSKYVYSLRVEFDAGCTREGFLDGIAEKLKWAIESSFVPDRDDKVILKLIEGTLSKAKAQLVEPTTIFKDHKSFAKFFAQTSIGELKNLTKVAAYQMKKAEEKNSSDILYEFLAKLDQFEVQITK
jgi:lauroyl/myristoyl acyltransferase